MTPENERRARLDRRQAPHPTHDLYQRIDEKLVQIDGERRMSARRQQDSLDRLGVAAREKKETTEYI
jgi:hypothetical protein